MILDIIFPGCSLAFGIIYKTINQRIIENFLLFIRGFEVAIFVLAAIIFLLIAVGITLRRMKQLPDTYEIQIFDLDGRQAEIDGLRLFFSTHDVAESFARQYRKTYVNQYEFKVVGRQHATYNGSTPFNNTKFRIGL
jgi:hypothetical protein